MAAAEARAAWQRTANRCFVQEDAKRASKLPCCPTSSTSSKPVDSGPTSGPDVSTHPVAGFASLSGIPSSSTLPADAKWWLLLQPNFSNNQKGLTYEPKNASEADAEIIKTIHGDLPHEGEDSKFVESTTASLERDFRVKKQGVKGKYNENAKGVADIKEYYQVMEMDLVGVSKQPDELCFDSDSVWFGSEKSEPWWRTTDTDELASLVSQKSLHSVENCDLPTPQKMKIHRDPFSQFGCLDDGVAVSSTDCGTQSSGISSWSARVPDRSTLKGTCGRQLASTGEVLKLSVSVSNIPLSSSHKNTSEAPEAPESDFSKAQLLEALCHSQTRAREAEKEAKQAKAEKEHIVELFLRQASQLFAYKQWFQLLQLEDPNLRAKNTDQSICALFPALFPRMPSKGKKLRRSWQKGGNRKRGNRPRHRHDIRKYALAFALGFSFVGAGLLLGWTVGWMLPSF